MREGRERMCRRRSAVVARRTSWVVCPASPLMASEVIVVLKMFELVGKAFTISSLSGAATEHRQQNPPDARSTQGRHTRQSPPRISFFVDAQLLEP